MADDPIEVRVGRLEDTVERLDVSVFGCNGSSTLEERLKKYADDRDIHKKTQVDQALVLLYQLVENNEKRRDKTEERTEANHRENTKKLDRLTWFVAIGVGIVITLQFLVPYIILRLKTFGS